MAFSPEEAAAMMNFGSEDTHFSRRAEGKGKEGKTDAQSEHSGPDVYTKRVPIDMYTRFLAHCRDLEFEEAIALSKKILLIDPSDKVIRQYIPVLEAHIDLQDDDDDEEEDDPEEDGEDDAEDSEDNEEEDSDRVSYEGKEQREGKEREDYSRGERQRK